MNRNGLMKHVGDWITRLGSQNKVAEKCGISSTALSQWMNGKYGANTTELDKKIAAALDRSTMTVKTALSELEDAGLIERRRSGFSKPNRIYVKMPPDGQKTFQVTDRKPSSIGFNNGRDPELT